MRYPFFRKSTYIKNNKYNNNIISLFRDDKKPVNSRDCKNILLKKWV